MSLKNNALTTYESIKARLGLLDDTEQALIEGLINEVSQEISNYCKRKFNLQTYNEKYKGNNYTDLLLNQYPITELKEVLIAETEIELTEIEVLEEDGILYYEKLWIKSGYGTGITGTMVIDFRTISVEYDAGYTLPKDVVDYTLPIPLKNSCENEVIYKYNSQRNDTNSGVSGTVKQEKLQSASVSYEDSDKSYNYNYGMLFTTISTLNSYKKPVILWVLKVI